MKNPSINCCKVGTIIFAMAAFFFAACGGDSDSPSKVADKNDGREVATVLDMGRCTSEREGDTVYVAEKMKDYLCRNRTWVDLSEILNSGSSRSSSSVVSNKTSAASGKSSSSSVATDKTSAASSKSSSSSVVTDKTSAASGKSSSSSVVTDKTSAASGKSSSSSVATDKTSAASGKSSSSSVASNTSSATSNASAASSSSEKTDSPEIFIRENISVIGVAQKGPFKFGSPLNLYELKNDLNPSGRVYKDEISSNKGDFVIPKVSLAYPYAKLEVRGLYRNEVTGEWSKDSMTLRALTDFSDNRTETNLNDRAQVNINLLTHLEYDRVLYLVQQKGYSVFAAKKQAAQEIMTAFEFATAVTYSEDFAIFQNEGVSAGTIAGNASLLAISALVMADRNDAKIQSIIDKFREDIKTDGEWSDLQTKANMADWAYSFKYDNIRASVKSWNILDIPDYETYLDIFWNNVFGLGGCSVNRRDLVATNSNMLSKYYRNYFICKSNGVKYDWQAATTYEKDTYEWNSGKNGEFKKGNVTDSIYVYNGSKWEFSERETAIGLCQKSNAGVISKFNNVHYICRDNAWTTATMLEYDTYGLTGVEGDVKAGVVNKDKYYVYENGKWHEYVPLSSSSITLKSSSSLVKISSSSVLEGYVDPSTVVKGTMTDSRDNQTYMTIQIGTQTWMAQNLNYESTNSYCYNDSAKYCSKYGRLYRWNVARTACPSGWHLPTKAEFETLFTAVGSLSTAGKILKSTSGWKSGGNSTDDYSFSALPAGGRLNGENYDFEGIYALFLSSTEYSSYNAYYMSLCYYYDNAGLYSSYKYNGFSVRCVKD